MLKKHIRTHTDLRPYKCRHCSFAFKTKGNLTKHMKSKAHHKKCTELGIIPVPTTTDDSQIDEEALAKQIEKKKIQFSDGEDADDDDEDDTDESDDECESDTSSMMASNTKPKTITNGHPKKSGSQEKLPSESIEESFPVKCEPISQQMVEQEAARSLLHLSALGEPSQWSTSTGDLTDVASCETDTGSMVSNRHEQTLSQYGSPTVSTIVLPGMSSKTATDQATLSWIPTETSGHRPRSYSADIPSSGGKELLARYRLAKNTAVEVASNTSTDDAEFGAREQFTRRYSISVAREARRPRILQPPEWGTGNLLTSTSHKWPDLDSSDQPMDLSVTRDLGRGKGVYGHGIAGSLLTVVTQEEAGLENTLPIHLETCLTEPYPLKSLPVLSPQILTEYEGGGENSNSDAATLIQQSEEQSSFSSNSANRSVFYMPDISTSEGAISRKESDIHDDPPSPDISDYAVCSPVSPPNLDDNSYYYGQEGLGQTASTPEEMPPTSRFHAEFIVPSTSSSMEDGKCVCRICNKIFAKSSHLRLHVNIHYFERPFRCDNCAVSFRTKGHLQKHKRSVSHYNKVNMNLTFGTPTVDNPRPFKCADCKIAFRIHGHLAKHLRSKMHIMKLECLGKLPFGMYAEMERSGISLNEIDTTDCNNSLESLQVMAQKLYQRDPRRMRWQGTEQMTTEIDHAKSTAPTIPLIEPTLPVSEPLAVTFNLPCTVVGLPTQSVVLSKNVTDSEDVKQEPSELEAFRNSSVFSEREGAVSPLSRYLVTQPPPPPSQEVSRKADGPETDSAISLHRSGTCHICGRLFKSAKFLQVHLYCDHPTWNPSSVNDVTSSNSSAPSSQDLVCDLCGRHFPNQTVLQQHLLSHAQPRPFVCEVCDAGFTSSASLIAHQSTHQTNTSASAASETRLVQLR